MSLFKDEILQNTLVINNNKCGKCKHIERHEYRSKIIHYCGIRKSNRTSNGKLKVKCKNTACIHFISE